MIDIGNYKEPIINLFEGVNVNGKISKNILDQNSFSIFSYDII